MVRVLLDSNLDSKLNPDLASFYKTNDIDPNLTK